MLANEQLKSCSQRDCKPRRYVTLRDWDEKRKDGLRTLL